MRRDRYGTYRGDPKGTRILKAVIAVLAGLLVVGIAAFFLMERYLVYTDEGIRLELPFLHREDPTPTPPQNSAPLVLVTATPEPTPQMPSALRAAELPHSALYDGTAEEALAQAGADAALFTMKRPDGTLGYISDLDLAKECQVSAADPALNAAIRGLNAGELYTVARVCCFQDDSIPYYHSGMAIRSGGGNWRDGQGRRWLNPANEAAQDYVAGICGELAALGFDEILLDFASFPESGNLTSIRVDAGYDSAKFAQSLTGFYTKAADALADYPQTKLSVTASASALMGRSAALSGQTPELLEETAFRIWTAAEEDQLDGLSDTLCSKLVLLTDTPAPSGSWAVLLS